MRSTTSRPQRRESPELTDRVEELGQALDRTRNEVDRRVERLGQELERARSDADDRIELLETVESDLQAARAEAMGAKSELRRLHELEGGQSRLEVERDALRLLVGALAGRVESLEGDAFELEMLGREQAEQLHLELQSDLAFEIRDHELDREGAEAAPGIVDLEAALFDAEGELEQLRSEIESRPEVPVQLQQTEDRGAERAETERAQAERAEAEQQARRSKERADQLATELEKRRVEARLLASDLESARETAATLRREKRDLEDELNLEIERAATRALRAPEPVLEFEPRLEVVPTPEEEPHIPAASSRGSGLLSLIVGVLLGAGVLFGVGSTPLGETLFPRGSASEAPRTVAPKAAQKTAQTPAESTSKSAPGGSTGGVHRVNGRRGPGSRTGRARVGSPRVGSRGHHPPLGCRLVGRRSNGFT